MEEKIKQEAYKLCFIRFLGSCIEKLLNSLAISETESMHKEIIVD